ncbi:hypothetical protein [Aeromicrobium sp.]|uniref:hypothetical protein n=1 Tax=Aeromicrobium sp. TaxID=1871063 RepID=UPI003D6A54D4
MIERLKKPGGNLGTLSLISTFVLGLIGTAGVVSMLVSLANGSDFWSDARNDKLIGLVFFALVLLGAVGFVVMDRSPWLGATLAVIGGLALATVVFWMIFTTVIGLGIAAVAVIRARALHGGAAPAPPATA